MVAFVGGERQGVPHCFEAQRIVADLLAMPLERSRVAIASRRALGLRTARLRVAGRLTELGPAELAFGVEECAELMLRRTGCEPSRDEAEAVWTATEGWPLGVALAAGSDRPAMARPARADGLNAYLAEELLDPLEPQLRDAIIDSSVAPELRSGAGARVGIARGSAGGDPAARDPVAGAGRRERAARLSSVGSRPARRAARSGSAHRSGEHGCTRSSARRWRRTAAGPKRSSTGWRPAATTEQESWWPATARRCWRPHPATVGRWLKRLPGDARAVPGLRLLEGQLAAGAGRLEDAEAPLREAVAGYAWSGEDEQAWVARAALAQTYVVRQRFEAAVRLADGYASSAAVAAPMVALMAAASLSGAGAYRRGLGAVRGRRGAFRQRSARVAGPRLPGVLRGLSVRAA